MSGSMNSSLQDDPPSGLESTRYIAFARELLNHKAKRQSARRDPQTDYLSRQRSKIG